MTPEQIDIEIRKRQKWIDFSLAQAERLQMEVELLEAMTTDGELTALPEWSTVQELAHVVEPGDIVQIEAEVFGGFPARAEAGVLGLYTADRSLTDWPVAGMKARIIKKAGES